MRIKLVVMGPRQHGKSWLCDALCGQDFQTEYSCAMFDLAPYPFASPMDQAWQQYRVNIEQPGGTYMVEVMELSHEDMFGGSDDGCNYQALGALQGYAPDAIMLVVRAQRFGRGEDESVLQAYRNLIETLELTYSTTVVRTCMDQVDGYGYEEKDGSDGEKDGSAQDKNENDEKVRHFSREQAKKLRFVDSEGCGSGYAEVSAMQRCENVSSALRSLATRVHMQRVNRSELQGLPEVEDCYVEKADVPSGCSTRWCKPAEFLPPVTGDERKNIRRCCLS
eukprot:TRINITY_DN11730_c0_g1_i1.p1 TRINITY_DN11730_c0_g1~~TRINITY_DN11730_c0_g1_i1.p1  ORF type:complete len:303 (+),score=42.22 TRINITY_DN11730_c0_g1_i1:73-909(+)